MENEANSKKKLNWTLAFAIASFAISLASCVPAYLSIIPYIGIGFAVIDIFHLVLCFDFLL